MSQGFASAGILDPEGEWQDWTPSYTNLTVGDGSISARYTQIGKLVIARFRFDLGSTSTIGTGPAISLPIDAVNGDANGPPLGTAICKDSTGAWFAATAIQSGTTDVGINLYDPSGTYISSLAVTATAPFTWTTSDILSFAIAYEAA